MKLFYHFLILVTASIILLVCANMLSPNHKKAEKKHIERSSNYLTNDDQYKQQK